MVNVHPLNDYIFKYYSVIYRSYQNLIDIAKKVKKNYWSVRMRSTYKFREWTHKYEQITGYKFQLVWNGSTEVRSFGVEVKIKNFSYFVINV